MDFSSKNLFLCFIYLLFLSLSCSAIDTITSNQPIKDGETLISSGKNFELGFFTPNNSRNRYVGIWYAKISERKYLWVANKEKPLTDSAGVLTIGEDRNLVLFDGRRNTVWSTNVSIRSNTSLAILLDTGNLVVRDGNSDNSEKELWESFNHPSNAFIPRMNIGGNIRTGSRLLITSWESADNPTPGKFSFGLDPVKPQQLFVWDRGVPRWRSGQWNGRFFEGIPNMEKDPLYFNELDIGTDNQGTVYFTLSFLDNSTVAVFEIASSGVVIKYDWNEGLNRWDTDWSAPRNECDKYNKCGPYGRCNDLNSPICSCLKGYVPKSEEEWIKGNWSSGCMRRAQWECENNNSNHRGRAYGDGFWKIKEVKLPDSAIWTAVWNADDCASECLKNCSCVAQAFLSGLGCLHWGGDLTDIQDTASANGELWIRLAHSELGKRKGTLTITIALVVVSGLGLVILAFCAYVLCKRSAKKRATNRRSGAVLSALGIIEVQNSSWVNLLRDGVKQIKAPEFLCVDFSLLVTATKNFSVDNKLGQGGFGVVYKGILGEGQEIAVKRLSIGSGQGMEEFKNEVTLISRLQHRNLVKLLGYCFEGEEKILIYEYMPNKSLDSILFDPSQQAKLDWPTRFHIIEGIARGLLYLHRDSRLRIIHRDLKPSNILLDNQMNPKISDFGIAKIFGGDEVHATKRVVGTYGYMSPEYALAGQFSEKSDVYSFGILLIEIVSGKRITGYYKEHQTTNLLIHAWQLWTNGKCLELVDPSMGAECSSSEVIRCIHVGLLCCQQQATNRPTMSNAISMLGSENIALLPTPNQPAFCIDAVIGEWSSAECSINDVTVTDVAGR